MNQSFDLTASILQLTSGPACGRLHDLAWDLAAGQLDPETTDLARQHLDHCAACRARLASLEAAQRLLPGFADLDPGEAFAGAVLARTRSLRPQALDPFLEGWARLMRRPRAALEAAYLATAAGLICTQIPVPGFDRTAGPALVTLIRRDVRPLAEAPLRQAWSSPLPAPAVAAAPSTHRLLRSAQAAWSRLTGRFQRGGQDLTRTLRALYERLRKPATEPSPASKRPAP
ncbi:MAG: hypothetical protein H6P99_2564 [Holophagaceae bacterium]|nr:hypothetical protein [Holophagaceae bacterium]